MSNTVGCVGEDVEFGGAMPRQSTFRPPFPENSEDTNERLKSRIMRLISAIDELICDQLNTVIHHPMFQRLEASWRGVEKVTRAAGGQRNIKIKLLDIKWPEIQKDLNRCLDFDQSELFNKIYLNEYGIAGGEPFGVILGDYEIHHKTEHHQPYDDTATLHTLSQISMAAFSPFICGASSKLFGIESYTTLPPGLDLDRIFTQQEYIPWMSLRDRDESRFLGLTLPRILMRHPYLSGHGNVFGITFREDIQSASDYLWGNAAYAFGTVLIREFINVGWFGHIRGVPRYETKATLNSHPRGGLVTELPAVFLKKGTAASDPKPLAEVVITDDFERRLSEHGTIPLCTCQGTSYAAFYSNRSMHKPAFNQDHDGNINIRLSSMLQHILCGSRIAHYIKVMIRDKVGKFMTTQQCERHLQEWLNLYTTGSDDMEWEAQAEYPLRSSSVEVWEHPGKAGCYLCRINLRPHYQVDQMVAELELVTEVSQRG